MPNLCPGKCPICKAKMLLFNPKKPFEHTQDECIDCGFTYNLTINRLSLEKINEIREDGSLELLTQTEYNKYKLKDFLLF